MQILADLQLQAINKRGGVPVSHDALDIVANLKAVGQQKVPGSRSKPPIELRPALVIVVQPPTDYTGKLSCLRGGSSTVLPRSIASARAMRGRVACGMITSSI
jgi:hypothetical protein